MIGLTSGRLTRRDCVFWGMVYPVFLLLLVSQTVSGQSQEAGVPEIILPVEVYLVPQTVYVGDRGRIVVNLGPVFNEAPAFVLVSPGELPAAPDLAISRMELEKRNDSTRLLLDFVSYAPGDIALPLIAIPSSGPEPFLLGGIEFTVASILTPDRMTLAGPAKPLAAPGTGWYVYGGLGLLLCVIIAGVAAFLSFNRFFGPLKKRFRKRRLLASLDQKILLLRGDTLRDEQEKRRELFSLLASEFRDFLSFETGINYSVLTPAEFAAFPVEIPGIPGQSFELGGLFGRWDRLRFKGGSLEQADLLEILDELADFFSSYNRTEKKA